MIYEELKKDVSNMSNVRVIEYYKSLQLQETLNIIDGFLYQFLLNEIELRGLQNA
jgi:hypothetical protein